MAPLRFQAVIVDNNTERRMRLKAATGSVSYFEKSYLFNTLSESEPRFQTEPMIDIALLSYEFPEFLLASFIEKVKVAPFGLDTAFVLVLPAKDQHSEIVAKNVIAGADGFLFEPYSVDQLDEIVRIAARVKKERSEARDKAAFDFLLEDLLQVVDRLSYLQSVNQDTESLFRKAREKAKMLHTLNEDRAAIYYDVLIEKTGEAPLPRRIYQEKYKGASKRVSERMERKLLDKLTHDADDEK